MPPSAPRRCDLTFGGIRTRVVPTDGGFLHMLESWLRDVADASDADAAMQFEVFDDRPPQRAVPSWTVDLGPARLWRDGESVHVAAASGSGGALDLGTGEGRVWVADGERGGWDAVYYCLRPLWVLGLARHGLHSIHASAVALDGRGVMMVGSTGMGKSTLALHLATLGARHLSDDLVFIAGRDGAPKMMGLADLSRVDPEGIHEIPDGSVRLPDGKVAVAAGTASSDAVTPGIILLLGAVPAGSRFERAPRAELMTALMGTGLFGIDPVSDQNRLQSLARLAESCPALKVPARPGLFSADSVDLWLRQCA